MDFEVQRCTRHCAATGRELKPGETFYSTLVAEGSQVLRRDYAAEAWQGPPEGVLGWWKSHLPARDARRVHWAPNDVMLELLEQLETQPEKHDMRYVLSLLLVRRRVVRLEDTQRDEAGDEISVLYCPRRKGIPRSHRHARRRAGDRDSKRIGQFVVCQRGVGALMLSCQNNCDRCPRSPHTAQLHHNAVWTQAGHLLVLVLGLIISCGAGCRQLMQQYSDPIPRALPPTASLNQVIEVVNDNSSRINSFYASRAKIGVPGFPQLNANIAFERPRNFRLRAETMFTGPEVDLGSNSELFWFWIRRNQPPAMFFCRHDQFAGSSARQIVPVEPEWLVQALGVVSFDAGEQHQGPFPVRAGRVEIRSTNPNVPASSADAVTRLTVIDDSRGTVLEEHLYDRSGQRIATAKLSKHVRDPASGVILPRHVEIEWPSAKFEMSIEMSDVQINHLEGNSQELFAKPIYQGFNEINLASPTMLAPPTSAPPLQQIPAASLPTRVPPIGTR